MPFAIPLNTDIPTESVAETYERLTGRKFADLAPEVQARFRFLPPDADMSDIEFGLMGRGA